MTEVKTPVKTFMTRAEKVALIVCDCKHFTWNDESVMQPIQDNRGYWHHPLCRDALDEGKTTPA
jgi:hypothetical protein